MLEVLIDNKNGNVWDISEMVTEVTWKTSRLGKVGSADIVFIKGGNNPNFAYRNGDIIRIKWNNRNVFYGTIFKVGDGKEEAVRLKCYDQLRRLLSKETIVMANVTATQIIQKIAKDFNLKTGHMVDTKHKVKIAEDDKTLIDIICMALDHTLISTTQNFVLYDHFGELTLRNINDLKSEIMIGDDSLMYDFSYEKSIDDDTFNRVKIVQDNKSTGKRDVYIAQDAANIGRWGRLQYFYKADEKMNSAQINNLLSRLITLKNRETKKLRIDAIGDLRIRAGYFIPVVIEAFKIDQYFLVDECTHKWQGADHTMTLEVKVI